jgi:hypothetical protein
MLREVAGPTGLSAQPYDTGSTAYEQAARKIEVKAL